MMGVPTNTMAAELVKVTSTMVVLQGIVFSVRPPKKSWKNIANLSGGEKTLSSLSLVFALHHYKPTPLYVMDEIDAALGMPQQATVPAPFRFTHLTLYGGTTALRHASWLK